MTKETLKGFASAFLISVFLTLSACAPMPPGAFGTTPPAPGTAISGVVQAEPEQTEAEGRQDRTAKLTADEKRLREQSENLQRTVWEGALIGAASGAIWGAIGMGDAPEIAGGAAIGALTGGLSGRYIARKQKQYADEEDQLESMILDVSESNEDTQKFIESANRVLAEDQRRLASLQKRYRSGSAASSDLAGEKERLAANRTVVKKAAQGAREKYKMFEGAEREFKKKNPDVDTLRFQRELKSFNEQIQALDGVASDISIA